MNGLRAFLLRRRDVLVSASMISGATIAVSLEMRRRPEYACVDILAAAVHGSLVGGIAGVTFPYSIVAVPATLGVIAYKNNRPFRHQSPTNENDHHH